MPLCSNSSKRYGSIQKHGGLGLSLFVLSSWENLLEKQSWFLETQGSATVDIADESAWEKGLIEDGSWHIWTRVTWVGGGTSQNRDSSLWMPSPLLVWVWLCLQQWVLWLVVELCWEMVGAWPADVSWAGLGTQLGEVGGYLLSAAVEPTSHALLFIGEQQWLGVKYCELFHFLLDLFCSLTWAGDFGIRWLPLWDRSNSGGHVPTL